jgi:hypothetical protein
MSTLAKRKNDSLAVAGESEWDVLVQQAQTALESGFLPRSITKPAQAIAIAMTGAELGMSPMTSFRFIHVIEGKPGLSAEGFLALAYQKVAGFGHQITRNDDKCAEVKMWRPGVEPTSFKFTIEDAAKAGLVGKDVWKKYGQRMLLWRAIKWGVQTTAPEAGLGMKSVDELEEISESDRRPPTRVHVAQVRNDVPAASPGVDVADKVLSAELSYLTADEFAALKQQMEAAVEQADLDDLDGKAEGWLSPEQNKEYRGHYAHMKNRIAKRKREAAATQDAAPESVK